MHSSAERRAMVKHKDNSFIASEANALGRVSSRVRPGRLRQRTGRVAAESETHAGTSCQARQGPRRSDAQNGTKSFRALSPAVDATERVQDRPPNSGGTGRR